MPPFDSAIEPVALPGQAVKLDPANDVYRVVAVEQMARIGPVDFGPANSGNTATESGSNIIDLADEVEMNDRALGQFWLNPLSDVEVEVRQPGQQDQRFVNANQVGLITPRTPRSMRQVFVHQQNAPEVIINNNNTFDLDKTLLYFTGYKLELGEQLTEGEVRGEPGPASVPVGTLKHMGQTARR